MKSIYLISMLLTTYNAAEPEHWKIDFHHPEESNYWLVVNDTVMGGVSQSSLVISEGIASFSGELSTENNGGFASVRRVGELPLSSSNGPLRLTALGDGKEYQIRLRTNRTFDGVAYVAKFSTENGQLQTFKFNEDDFAPRYRGRRVHNALPLSFNDSVQVGVMLSGNQTGYFQLSVKYIGQ